MLNYKIIALLTGTSILVGCASPGAYRAPVEDRNRPGTVVSVEPSKEVKVAPIYDAPNFAITAKPVQKQTQAIRQENLPINRQANSAVVALLAEAQQSANSGDLAGAESQVERALRIAPRDPQVYLHLASIKRRQMNYLQAEQVALRGVAVASGLPDYQRLLWRELAQIREMVGDNAGAKEARLEASR